MRRSYLPFGLMKAFLGFTFFLFFTVSLTGQNANTDQQQIDQERWESIRVNQNTGTINPLDYQKAREQAEAMYSDVSAGAVGLNWTYAGPTNYPGLVWSAIYDKNDATGQTILAGTAQGGVWKSTNGGLTWKLFEVENNVSIPVSSIVQTSNGTIYAATGVMTCKSIKYTGAGIFRSSNGSPLTVISSTKGNADFAGVSKLAVDPASGRLYAATFGGLYYSDNGDEWTKLKSGYATDVAVGSDGSVLAGVGDSVYLATGGNLSSWVTLTTGKAGFLPKTGYAWMTFAIAPSDANYMYVCLAGIDGRLVGVYASADKGASWSVAFPANPTFEPFGTNLGCYSNTMVVFPDNPKKLFLGGVNLWYGEQIQASGFYNWEELSSGVYSPWFPNSAPRYHHSYMFKPGSTNQFVLASDGGVSVGNITPEGIEFQTSNKTLGSSQFYSVAYSVKKHFLLGGGVNVGTLGLGYFYPSAVNSPNEGYPLDQPSGMLLGSNGGTCVWSNLNYNVGVFTMRGSTSTIRRQDFTDLTYDNDVMNGLSSIYPDYSPMHLWESFKFAQTKDSVKLKAYGMSYPKDTVVQVESANLIKFSYKLNAPLAIGDSIMVPDPVASRFFFYGNKAVTNYGYGVYMTKDMLKFYKAPDYFVVLKDTATKVDLISTIAVSSDLNTLWAGTKKGRLIRVTGLVNANDSATANAYSEQCVLVKDVFMPESMTGRYVTSISINPTNADQILVTLGNSGNTNYVFYTSNGLSASPTFNSVQTNLPNTPVLTGLLEMHGNNAIVGTDIGVFSTNNLTSGTPQWAPDMANLGIVPVSDIRQQTMRDYHVLNYGAIYMATQGRGLWMDTTFLTPVGIEQVTAPAGQTRMMIVPNPASDMISIGFNNADAGNLEVSLFDLTGRVVKMEQFGYVAAGEFRGTLSVKDLPAGSYILKAGNVTGKLIKK